MIAGGNHTSVSCRDSGKGGAVGIFDLLPFNEPHPLSQAVRPASSPIGEPRGLLRIRPRFHETITAYRKTPLRLAKSRLTAVARLHSACGRTSQPCRFRSAVKSASSPIGEPSLTSPERGGGPRVSVAEGFAVRRIPFRKSRANPHRPLAAPFWGGAPRSESR